MELAQLEIVQQIRPVSRTEIRVYVQEAGPAIPVLLERLNAGNCTVGRIEEYRPNFDEVFIELMNKDAAARGEEAGDEQAD